MSYYKTVNGKQLDARLLEQAEKSIKGEGDGRISMADAEILFSMLKDSNQYTDIEKETMEYIRDNFKWTEASDAWFRAEIARWAVLK
jgi:hypothetical protein